MAYDPDLERTILRQFLEINRISARALCKASDLSPALISQFLSGRTRSLTSSTYQALRAGASKLLKREVRYQDLAHYMRDEAYEEGRFAALRDNEERAAATRYGEADESTSPPAPSGLWTRDVPVYGTSSITSEDADFAITDKVVDHVRRPPRIQDREDVFAIYQQGDLMYPWRQPGQIVYVERARAPRHFDYVFLELKSTSGEARVAMVRNLNNISRSKPLLAQHNPLRSYEFDRKKVQHLYRVMEFDELLAT